jgi:hypothetical protein
MHVLDWFRLLILQQKLKFAAFGKYNRYRCWCLERNVESIAGKIRLAREVLNGPGVSLAESQHNVDFIRRHSVAARKATNRTPKNTAAVIQGTPPADASSHKPESQRLPREKPGMAGF